MDLRETPSEGAAGLDHSSIGQNACRLGPHVSRKQLWLVTLPQTSLMSDASATISSNDSQAHWATAAASVTIPSPVRRTRESDCCNRGLVYWQLLNA